MNLIILQDGFYNDSTNRAHARKAGDHHETGPDYGRSLIASGLAVVDSGLTADLFGQVLPVAASDSSVTPAARGRRRKK